MYLTYDEYQAYGGTASAQDFPLLEFRARKRIDYLTDSRVAAMCATPEAVKLCMMSVIRMEAVVGTEAQAVNPVVTSYSTDGYSESYGKALSATDAEQSMNRVVAAMLAGEVDDNGVPLLYRGVYPPRPSRGGEQPKNESV